MAELDGDSQYITTLSSWTDKIRNEKPKSPGGMVYLDQWGTLRHAANVGFVMFRVSTFKLKSFL